MGSTPRPTSIITAINPGAYRLTSESRSVLSRYLPELWHVLPPTAANRQRVIWLLIKEVVITVRGESERLDVTIHWAGGISSTHELVRPVQHYQQMSNYRRLLDRIDELRKAEQTLIEVAKQLNREGFHLLKRLAMFTKEILDGLLAKHGSTSPYWRIVAAPGVLGEHEWLLPDLAQKLKMPPETDDDLFTSD